MHLINSTVGYVSQLSCVWFIHPAQAEQQNKSNFPEEKFSMLSHVTIRLFLTDSSSNQPRAQILLNRLKSISSVTSAINTGSISTKVYHFAFEC